MNNRNNNNNNGSSDQRSGSFNQHQRLRRLAYKNGASFGSNLSNGSGSSASGSGSNSSSSSLAGSRQTLETLIYKASAEGDDETLRKLFDGRDADFLRDCLNYVPPMTSTTPLIVAARNGHNTVVQLLLAHGADPTQCGSVIFDGDHIPRVPPLWAAAAAGHLEVVRSLVGYGVDVNQSSSTNSTPLRGACYDGHLGIVEYLVEHGADIEIPNRHGHTALMIAAYRMKSDVVEYLLRLGAQYDRRSLKGNTALHDAAEAGSEEIVKMLLGAGAKLQPDDYGVSPLLTAANLGHVHLLPHFFPHADVWERRDAWKLLGATMVDRRNDYGNAIACWRNSFSFGAEQLADELERKRMDLKWEGNAMKRRIYGEYREARCVADVDQLIGDPEAIRMQALLVRERILGESHLETHYYLRYRGRLLCDHHQWARAFDCWAYLLQLQQHYLHPLSASTHSTLVEMFEAFSALVEEHLIHQNHRNGLDPRSNIANVPTIEQVVWVLERTVWEVERFIRLEDNHRLELVYYEERNLKTECEGLLHLSLQLVHVIYRIKAFLSSPLIPPVPPPFLSSLFHRNDPHNFQPANQWALNAPVGALTTASTNATANTASAGGASLAVGQLRQQRERFDAENYLAATEPFCSNAYLCSPLEPLPELKSGEWPLRPRCPHLRCLLRRALGAFRLLQLHPLHMACAEQPFEDFHRMRVPSKFVVEWLLRGGADAWEVDEEEETALHVALHGDSPKSNIVKLLLDAGAPLLARNKANETALQLMQRRAPDMPRQLRIGRYLSLKQLAANAVMRNLSGLKTFDDILPRDLEDFLRVF